MCSKDELMYQQVDLSFIVYKQIQPHGIKSQTELPAAISHLNPVST